MEDDNTENMVLLWFMLYAYLVRQSCCRK